MWEDAAYCGWSYGLGSVRKQAKQAMWSILPPGPFCLSAPILSVEVEVKPLPSSELLVLVFHHHNSNPDQGNRLEGVDRS